MTRRPQLDIVEPLRRKLARLVRGGERQCCTQALALFGNEIDIRELCDEISNAAGSRRQILVDFTPFATLGTQTRWQELQAVAETVPFKAIVRQGIVLEQFKVLKNISTIVCTDAGEVVFADGSNDHRKGRQIIGLGESFLDLHRTWVESRLLDALRGAIRKPPPDRRYLRLSDDTWADKWIDVKAMLADPDVAFFAAYQMGYALTAGFSHPIPEDGFLVGNNTAYLLAGLLQSIFDNKHLFIVDRMGPYPSLSATRLRTLDSLDQRKFCVIEDVISTGRELDMLRLLLFSRNARIDRVISLFDLEIASPLLLQKASLMSLCRPSREIKYERLPKYALEEQG